MGAEVYHALKKVLKTRACPPASATRAASRRTSSPTSAALDLIGEAIKSRPATAGTDIALALDVAASEFYKDGAYTFEGGQEAADEMIDYYAEPRRRSTRWSPSRTR
jgi:enolase